MAKLINTIAILSPANKTATLTAIDVEAKTCTIDNGTEKVINWSTIAAYKVADTGRTLTPKLLTALHTESAQATPKQSTGKKRIPKGDISENEKIFLSMIPLHPDFKGVDSVLGARAVIKQAQEAHGLSVITGRAVFASLKNKGYYTAKGKESGQRLTTLQLTELGIQYLKENSLIAENTSA